MVREVAIAAHLAARGAPALRPKRRSSARSVRGGRLASSRSGRSWITARRPRPTPPGAGAALKRLHEALAGYEGVLPAYFEAVADCAALAEDESAMAAALPQDRRFLAGRVRAGLERLPAGAANWIALHGDAHLGNLMMTPAGAIWADFEATCRGPLEWDLLNRPAAFLAPFGRLDADLLRELGALRRACVAVWCWADAERDAEFREAAEYHTTRLRNEAASRFA